MIIVTAANDTTDGPWRENRHSTAWSWVIDDHGNLTLWTQQNHGEALAAYPAGHWSQVRRAIDDPQVSPRPLRFDAAAEPVGPWGTDGRGHPVRLTDKDADATNA